MNAAAAPVRERSQSSCQRTNQRHAPAGDEPECGNFREIARQNHGLIVPAYRRTRDCLAPLALCLVAMRRKRGGTASTSHSMPRRTSSVTLPSKIRFRPVRPRVPITTRSTSSALHVRTIAS